MRPRLRDQHLPRGVYLRHGAYYRVIRGRWLRLGSDEDAAHMEIDEAAVVPMDRAALLAYTQKVIVRARHNAKGRRQIPFDLTRDDALQMLRTARWCCSVTGIQFDLVLVGGKRPYAPSIDRRDSEKGYSVENCRVVCVAANFAMNVWGEQVLQRMLRSARKTKVLDMSNSTIAK